MPADAPAFQSWAASRTCPPVEPIGHHAGEEPKDEHGRHPVEADQTHLEGGVGHDQDLPLQDEQIHPAGRIPEHATSPDAPEAAGVEGPECSPADRRAGAGEAGEIHGKERGRSVMDAL